MRMNTVPTKSFLKAGVFREVLIPISNIVSNIVLLYSTKVYFPVP